MAERRPHYANAGWKTFAKKVFQEKNREVNMTVFDDALLLPIEVIF